MLAYISLEPSLLATKLYVVQEVLAVLLIVAILVAIANVFLAVAVLLEEAGRAGLRWGKRSVRRFARHMEVLAIWVEDHRE
jgi:hypothetical protein